MGSKGKRWPDRPHRLRLPSMPLAPKKRRGFGSKASGPRGRPPHEAATAFEPASRSACGRRCCYHCAVTAADGGGVEADDGGIARHEVYDRVEHASGRDVKPRLVLADRLRVGAARDGMKCSHCCGSSSLSSSQSAGNVVRAHFSRRLFLGLARRVSRAQHGLHRCLSLLSFYGNYIAWTAPHRHIS